MINVTIWNENLHERTLPEIQKVYPNGIHGAIKEFLCKDKNIAIKTATMDMDNQGISRELLENTDVLIWWSHALNDELTDENAELIAEYVQRGMGFIPLHSSHMCKPLRRLLGTTMTLKWKDNDSEKIYVTSPSHPIAKNIPMEFELTNEEMYGEYFDIPKPEDVIFTGWFKGGCVFRSGVTFTRGNGRIFYFQPGHEEFPIYYNPVIQQIIMNAVYWTGDVNKIDSLRDNIQLS